MIYNEADQKCQHNWIMLPYYINYKMILGETFKFLWLFDFEL